MRNTLAFVFLSTVIVTTDAQAQRCQHGSGYYHGYMFPPIVLSYPPTAYGPPMMYYERTFGYTYGYRPPVQVINYPPPVTFTPTQEPLVLPPAKSLTTPSSAAARQKSFEHQERGDQKMREQKWSDARVTYATAVSTAPDRAEAHLRLAICYATISKFDLALKQLKLSITQDPAIAQTSPKLDLIFGPNSQIVRNTVVAKVADWTKEDMRNSDRLYLLGAILYFNGDHRSKEYLAAALKANPIGNNNHINAFLNASTNGGPVPPQPMPDGIPVLKDQAAPPTPAPPPITPLGGDVRFPKLVAPSPSGAITPPVTLPIKS